MRIHSILDSHGNPIGLPVDNTGPAQRPGDIALDGRRVRLERLDPARHAAELYAALSPDTEGTAWTYMLNGPYESETEFAEWVATAAESTDPFFYAVVDKSNGATVGYASYLRIDPNNRCIEVGNLNFSVALKRSALSTEAQYLMARNAFELGYRRYEWKCNALNAPSITAAERLGFSFEGVFRNAIIVKGHNRDTAWFAFTDEDWVGIRDAMETWLDDSNFDDAGNQIVSLRTLTAASIHSRWPNLTVER